MGGTGRKGEGGQTPWQGAVEQWSTLMILVCSHVQTGVGICYDSGQLERSLSVLLGMYLLCCTCRMLCVKAFVHSASVSVGERLHHRLIVYEKRPLKL